MRVCCALAACTYLAIDAPTQYSLLGAERPAELADCCREGDLVADALFAGRLQPVDERYVVALAHSKQLGAWRPGQGGDEVVAVVVRGCFGLELVQAVASMAEQLYRSVQQGSSHPLTAKTHLPQVACTLPAAEGGSCKNLHRSQVVSQRLGSPVGCPRYCCQRLHPLAGVNQALHVSSVHISCSAS